MIPDKIYLPKYPIYDIEGEHLGDDWSYEPEFTDNVTYIRKDALMEWLNRMLEISAQSFEFQRNYAFGKKLLTN